MNVAERNLETMSRVIAMFIAMQKAGSPQLYAHELVEKYGHQKACAILETYEGMGDALVVIARNSLILERCQSEYFVSAKAQETIFSLLSRLTDGVVHDWESQKKYQEKLATTALPTAQTGEVHQSIFGDPKQK